MFAPSHAFTPVITYEALQSGKLSFQPLDLPPAAPPPAGLLGRIAGLAAKRPVESDHDKLVRCAAAMSLRDRRAAQVTAIRRLVEAEHGGPDGARAVLAGLPAEDFQKVQAVWLRDDKRLEGDRLAPQLDAGLQVLARALGDYEQAATRQLDEATRAHASSAQAHVSADAARAIGWVSIRKAWTGESDADRQSCQRAFAEQLARALASRPTISLADLFRCIAQAQAAIPRLKADDFKSSKAAEASVEAEAPQLVVHLGARGAVAARPSPSAAS